MSPAPTRTSAGAKTLIVRVADALTPSLSVAVAVIVWVPTLRSEREKLGPVPRGPSMLDVHTRLPATLPSWLSCVPWNGTGSPWLTVAFTAGEPMVTIGGVFTDWVDWYSTCSRGAWAAAPSQERATRTPLPVPLTSRARALVGYDPGRSTVSW